MPTTIKPLVSTTSYIPTRFRREVVLHLFKNLVPAPPAGVPLILGVHGPSGEGKTYQCDQILDDVGAFVELISGGELESVDAGEPARLIRQKYRTCGSKRHLTQNGVVALVFNDIDAAIGNWGELVQYTVNRQTIFGELMHLADFPTRVEGAETARVPIIVTGNDFTRLHGPVTRPGRMRSFSWIPEQSEKVAVLASVFDQLSELDCRSLLDHFPDEPLAFFVQLKNQVEDDMIWSVIQRQGEHRAFSRLAAGEQPRLHTQLALDTLLEAGKSVATSSALVNHLRR